MPYESRLLCQVGLVVLIMKLCKPEVNTLSENIIVVVRLSPLLLRLKGLLMFALDSYSI